MEPMDINGLIEYLKREKNIEVSEKHQYALMNMGYYHGYKGYRYIQSPQNRIPYTEFEQLAAIYEFDSKVKALFYPCVMTIETALKNHVLEVVVSQAHSDSFADVYNMLLNTYKTEMAAIQQEKSYEKKKRAREKAKKEIKRRLELRNRIYKVQTDAFANGNRIADHFLNNDRNIPIWGIFELLSLGEFGHFVSCLNGSCRRMIAEKIGMEQKGDTQAMLPQRVIYAVKDLRNAIAHNDVVFDTRFRTSGIDKQVSTAVEDKTQIKDITFDTITDWLILIVYLLNLLHVNPKEIKAAITAFECASEELRKKIPILVYTRIIHTDAKRKLEGLKTFASEKA